MAEKTGVIHGRFQCLHLKHMEYLLAAKKQCDRLIIGISNPDAGFIRTNIHDTNRSRPENNPFTYFERYEMIREAMLEFHVPREEFEIVPFPINTPELIRDAADKFGSQCVVVAIDAKKRQDGSGWNIYKNGGRVDVGIDAVEWAQKVEQLGAGEILLTSMDCDGTKSGYDLELTKAIAQSVSIPVIASGGAGKLEHFKDALAEGMADAALAASLFHYKELEIRQVKEYLAKEGVSVRL